MEEKRKFNRESSEIMSDAMFLALKDMTNKITDHMIDEEKNRIEDMSFIKDQLKPLDALVDSLPRDNQGQPSTYIHRNQHNALSSATETAGLIKSGITTKITEYVVLAIIVVLASGNWEHVLKALIK